MTHDNIFESDCDAIVNTVNCVGVMGGGLAKAFRTRYPDMNLAYQHACARGEVKVGKMWTWFHHGSNLTDPSRWIINFPTKDDWRNPSQMEYVYQGLVDLGTVVKDLQLGSIAIPALGCGLGGLEWNDICPMLEGWGGAISDFGCALTIYPPEGKAYLV